MTYAPITLFVYNRREHTRRTVEALEKNTLAKESELFIFSDGAKDTSDATAVADVRNYLRTISGFKKIEIIERSENVGLARSIISGVTDIVNRFGSIIVLEDDMVTSPYFLTYMNEALALYENADKVISIHGYVYPTKERLPETFFLRGADCWGWATWKRGWALFEKDGVKLLAQLEEKKLTYTFDMDGSFHFTQMLKRQIKGKNNSWAIRWYASAFLANKLTLYPGRSLVDNIGQDASGTHGNKTDVYRSQELAESVHVKKLPLEEDTLARGIVVRYFRSLHPTLLQKIKTRLFGRSV